VPLRQFLYYDESLVNDFLSQLEGGQSEEQKKREQLQRDRKGELNVGIGPVKAGGGRGRSVTEETEAVIRQGRASNFERLHQILVEADELTEVEDLDEQTWERVGRGSLVELDVQLSVPMIVRMFSSPDALANFSSLLKAMKHETTETDVKDVDVAEKDETFDRLTSYAKLGLGQGETLTVIGRPPRLPYNLIMRLDRKSVIPGADLEGEVTVLVKMARKLKADDRELVIEMPGISMLEPEKRRSIFENSEVLTVKGPGAIMVPIAVFR
jgi:hypothetical protein